jgi:hydrogenase maturation factor
MTAPPPDLGGACGPDEHCITCGDLAVPMRVLGITSSGTAICAEESGATGEVMIELVGRVDVGDTVLVHAGTALHLARRAERLRR